MSWRMLKVCSVMLTLMAACCAAATILSIMFGLNIVAPCLLSLASFAGAILFWNKSNEEAAIYRQTQEDLKQNALAPAEAIEALYQGNLTYEQYHQLLMWTGEELNEQNKRS